MAYFTSYFKAYFEVGTAAPPTDGGFVGGGGLIGPNRLDIKRAKRWLEVETDFHVSITDKLGTPSEFVVLYGVSPQEATKIEVTVRREVLTLPKRKISLSGNLPTITESFSLTATWKRQIAEDEELLLLL